MVVVMVMETSTARTTKAPNDVVRVSMMRASEVRARAGTNTTDVVGASNPIDTRAKREYVRLVPWTISYTGAIGGVLSWPIAWYKGWNYVELRGR